MAIFSVIWGIGASTDENTREKFSEIVSHMIQGLEVKD